MSEGKEITLLVKIKGMIEAGKFQAAEKEIAKLEDHQKKAASASLKFAQDVGKLNAALEKMNEVGGEASVEKLARLKGELAGLATAARSAGVAENELAAATNKMQAGMAQAQTKIAATRLETTKLNAAVDLQAMTMAKAAGAGAAIIAAFSGGVAAGNRFNQMLGTSTELSDEFYEALAVRAKGAVESFFEALVGGHRVAETELTKIETEAEFRLRKGRELRQKNIGLSSEAIIKMVDLEVEALGKHQFVARERMKIDGEAHKAEVKKNADAAKYAKEHADEIAREKREHDAAAQAAKRQAEELARLNAERRKEQEPIDQRLLEGAFGNRQLGEGGGDVFSESAAMGARGEDIEKERSARRKQQQEAIDALFQRLSAEKAAAKEGTAVVEEEQEKRLRIARDLGDQGVELLKSLLDEEIAAEEEGTARWAALRKERAELDKDAWKESLSTAQEYLGYMSQAVDMLAELEQSRSAQRLARIEAEKDRAIEAARARGQGTAAIETKYAALAEAEKKKAFDKNKDYQIAQAFMNTAASVMQMMAAPWPVNLVLAVLAAAVGAQQISAIQSSEYSGGGASAGAPSFDNPSNDAMARGVSMQTARKAALSAGRASAVDMVNHSAQGGMVGFVEALQSGNAQRENGATSRASVGSAAPSRAAVSSGRRGGGSVINQYFSPLVSGPDAYTKATRKALDRSDAVFEGPRTGYRKSRLKK